jgi:hypothetical protein
LIRDKEYPDNQNNAGSSLNAPYHNEEKLPSLDASGIAEYIRFDCCPRYFKLKFEGAAESGRKWLEAFKPISPLLYGAGKELEEKKVEELKRKASRYVDLSDLNPRVLGWEKACVDAFCVLKEALSCEFSASGKDDSSPVLFYQIPLSGHIGVWTVNGIADLIAVWPCKDGKVKLRIFEIKSSWKEQTAHRSQVAIYKLLLSKGLGELASNIEFEGGVINKESDLTDLSAECLPKFKLGPLVQDVERLLNKRGELFRIHRTPLSEVEYRLCWRCDNCGFNECCIVRSIERESVALLNLSRGEQNALRHYGIEHLEDLARLKYVPDLQNQRPYSFKEVRSRDVEKVRQLATDPVLGAQLDRIIQRAQFMLSGIRPNSPYANKTRQMPWLTGSGYGGLPEDSPVAGDDSSLSFRPDGMIRVYFHIEWDYMLDVISMISARVSCTRFKGEPVSISKIIKSLPDERSQCIEEEREMLEDFFSGVTKAIVHVAEEVGSPDEAPIHLYFFTQRERDVLMEAVRRQPSLMGARAVRDLLGLRQAIDQPMFSIIQDEVLVRKAAGFHSTGLLPVLEQSGYFDHNWWRVKRRDGSVVDLRMAFRDGFFNYILPFMRKADGSIEFVLGSDDSRPKDGFYPARARFGDQIPIEYMWAAKGRLDNSEEKRLNKIFLDKRMWCDYPQRTRRITDEELTLMGSNLCFALEHIERFLNVRNRRLGKKPIAIPKIAEFTLGSATLERSCREFLDLEYFAKRQSLYQHYAMLPFQRAASGRSVIFECVEARETDQDFLVRGKLVFEAIILPDSGCLANACRVKGSDGSSSGDWMVVTELKRNAEGQLVEALDRSPSEVEKSARVIVDKVDLNKKELIIKVVSWPSGKSRKYSAWHNLPTTDPEKAKSKYMQLFESGRIYILDELADDIISERAAKCLDYSDNNALYGLLASFLSGKNEPSARVGLPKDSAADFLSWVDGRRFPPKLEQRRFIDRIFGREQIVMLQGPPGTGKTETLQLAVLAHLAAHRKTSRCRVLMVAPTHKAIHEFVSKLAGSWESYCEEGGKDLKDLRIYRVLSSNSSSAKPIEGVTYVNYNEDEETVNELRDSLMNQEKLVTNSSDNSPLILCVTPPGMYGIMKKIGGTEPPWGEGFFDLLVVDEASMMRVPELILSGAFVTKNAQILVAGDHRQLPPIMAHDWEKEDRRTLEEMAAFLSAQDFLRLLRQEDLGIDHIKCENRADIPAERLSETHRCHEVVAAFLKEWVYHKDGIDFRSDQNQTIALTNAPTKGLQAALKPENIIVLIVHDETSSFQSNLVEAQIVNAIVRNVPSEIVGIVSPHNAQRGVLKNLLSQGYENVRVDTVERFQGGENDMIIISSTVSDPDYVRTESDFLLNLNRINVAISRMKKKIVIVASRSIFEFMPQDAADYDKAILWRGIAQTVGFIANSEPEWQGSLSDFIGSQAVTAKVEVYSKSKK